MAQPASWWEGLGQRITPAVESFALRGKLTQGVQFLRQYPRMSGVVVGGLLLGVIFFFMGPPNTDKTATAPADLEDDTFGDIDMRSPISNDSNLSGGFHDGLDGNATANSQANVPTSVEVPRLFSPLDEPQGENSVRPASFESETGPAWLTGTIEANESPVRRTQFVIPNAPFGPSRQ
jgi:hypothetical protein